MCILHELLLSWQAQLITHKYFGWRVTPAGPTPYYKNQNEFAMKPLFTILLLSVAGLCFGQTVIYDPHVKIRKMECPFHAIEVTDGIAVHITPAQEASVAVSVSHKGWEDKVKTVIRNGELHVYLEETWRFWEKPKKLKVNVYVGYTQLRALNAYMGAIVKGEVKADNLEIGQSTGAALWLTGRLTTLHAKATMGALLNGYGLQVDKAMLRADSGAAIDLTVEEELMVVAGTGGQVSYRGNAQLKEAKVSMGGNVRKTEGK